MKNKIGWCNLTFNPVWGCLNHCEYCYARGIAKRFGERMAFWEMKYRHRDDIKNYYMGDNIDEHFEFKSRLQDFKPTFLERQFNKKLPKKPQRIFVGSMSEIAHWEKRWMEVVLGRILCYPQHTFQFLTKHPKVYSEYDFPKNCWLGVTITKDIELCDVSFLQFAYRKYANVKYICFEPLLRKIVRIGISKDFDWVIIGAETGNRKDKVIPKREWVENIINHCKDDNIPVYMKDNLRKIFPSWVKWIKEFPKEVGL